MTRKVKYFYGCENDIDEKINSYAVQNNLDPISASLVTEPEIDWLGCIVIFEKINDMA